MLGFEPDPTPGFYSCLDIVHYQTPGFLVSYVETNNE
jgi:hypothetical protein